MSELHRKLMKRLPQGPPSGQAPRRSSNESRNYAPLEWSAYFDSFLDLAVADANGTFRLYLKNIEPDDGGTKGPLLILLHGAGYSALSWGLFAKSISRLVAVKIVAIDLRGHGATKTSNDSDLSSERLTQDVLHIYQALCKHPKYCDHLTDLRVVFIGHSMGGAIATRATCASLQDCELLHRNLYGLVVVDVVEGTALEALSLMHGILRSRPTSFSSIENAIEWALRTGQTRNHEAARLSMPGMLKRIEEKSPLPPSPATRETQRESLKEVDEEKANTADKEKKEDNDGNDGGRKDAKEKKDLVKHTKEDKEKGASSSKVPCRYEWRVNLFDSQDHWKGWFTGLSEAFLQSKAPAKLLLLAGLDRLDKELTVGQMQGKFQMQILARSGHAIHEDNPDQVAQVIATFLVRHKLTVGRDDFAPSVPGC